MVEHNRVSPESPTGVGISHIEPLSPAARAGIKPTDRILGINDRAVHDTLDVYAAAFAETLSVRLGRGDHSVTITLQRNRGEDIGIELRPEKPTVCSNKCVFCFVDQMPAGLRESLYVKDEDYRLSFLHGNYLTLTNLRAADEERIRRMHLSPLYVSVHATEPQRRAKLLGRWPAEPVLRTLDRLGMAGIRFHAQVVLVPGYNTGKVLEQTLEDICSRHGYIQSMSVVPVGLTCHREGLPHIEPVGRERAASTVDLIDRIQSRMRRHVGRGLVYASDELMLLAEAPIPDASYYDDYPQMDNGVGLVRLLLESMHGVRVPGNLKGKRVALVTGKLAEPYVGRFADLLGRQGLPVEVFAVDNGLFGPSVTVSGLLSGSDMVDALRGLDRADLIVLPPNSTNPAGLTLDDLSLDDMAASLGVPVVKADYDLKQTIKRVKDGCEGK